MINKNYAGEYLIIGGLPISDTEAYVVGYCADECRAFATWHCLVGDTLSFDTGHYFDDYADAVQDLNERLDLWL